MGCPALSLVVKGMLSLVKSSGTWVGFLFYRMLFSVAVGDDVRRVRSLF